jgi:hypothetical protein
LPIVNLDSYLIQLFEKGGVMPKSKLEKSIENAANAFALEIVAAVKNATLQELIDLQGAEEKTAPKRGRKPGRKPGPKPGKRVGRKPGPKPGKKTGPKPDPTPGVKKKIVRLTKKTRRNYPKCAFPGCKKNRFPRGEGFCGEHWRLWKSKKIKDAASYKK